MKNAGLIARVRRTLRKHEMVLPGDLVLVAVSGGPDSVALLTVLAQLSPELDIRLHVFHLDHQLRPESAEDARFVAELAEGLHLPYTGRTHDVARFAEERRMGLETAARELRYQELQLAAMQAGATEIATGHTLDDQAETFLMRLTRGSGVTGLGSIPPVRGNIIRPLIESTREQVMEWCGDRALSYRIDETNLLPDQVRNTIRLRVLPVLKELNPGAAASIADSAEILEGEDEVMQVLTAERFQEIACMRPSGEIGIDLAAFRRLPRALKRRILHSAAGPLGVDPSSITFGAVEEVLEQVGRGGRVEAQLTGNVWVWEEYGGLIVGGRPKEAPSVERELKMEGSTPIPELGVTLTSHTQVPLPSVKPDPMTATLDKDAVRGALVVTPPRPGDRFRPFGMDGEKKLQDFFVDEKVPRRRRDSVPVVRDEAGIVWVVGHRIDERFRIDESTKQALVLEARAERMTGGGPREEAG